VREPSDPVAASAGRGAAGSARSFLLSGLAEIWDAAGETSELHLEQNTKIRLAIPRAIDQAREVINTHYHSAGATAIFTFSVASSVKSVTMPRAMPSVTAATPTAYMLLLLRRRGSRGAIWGSRSTV
jgi:hypothetical protein